MSLASDAAVERAKLLVGRIDDDGESIADVMADLFHLAESAGVEVDGVIDSARRHFGAERGEGDDLANTPQEPRWPIVEVIVVRDPDGDTTIQSFLNGYEVEPVVYTIDAGAGHDWQDWKAGRDQDFAAASSDAVREALELNYNYPPGSEYIYGKPDNEDWV